VDPPSQGSRGDQVQDSGEDGSPRAVSAFRSRSRADAARDRPPEAHVGTRPATQALILAAGRGSRLGNGPKCLCVIGGWPLIEHQLQALRGVGIDSVAVVVGFEQERVRDVIGGRVTFIVNEYYAETNSLYSFLLARDWVEQDLIVLNSDVLFHPYMAHILQRRSRNALLFDSKSGLEAEEMKVALRGDCLDEMSKDLSLARSRGENVGVLRLDHSAAEHAFAAAEDVIAAGGRRDWLASAINETARKHRFTCLDVAGIPWTEIDFPSDLARARLEVWPAIVERRWAERPLSLDLPAPALVSRRRSPSLTAT
jgi:choline kinase